MEIENMVRSYIEKVFHDLGNPLIISFYQLETVSAKCTYQRHCRKSMVQLKKYSNFNEICIHF